MSQSINDHGNDDSNSPTGLRQVGFTSILDEAKVFKIASDLSPVRKEMEIRSILENTNQMAFLFPAMRQLCWFGMWLVL